MLLGALGVLLVAPGCAWGALGVLLGEILTSGAALWLDRRYNDPTEAVNAFCID